MLTLPLVLWISGCSEPLSDQECEHLLDRYTDLLLKSDRPELSETARRELKLETRAQALKTSAFAECSEDVSREAFDCAMKATHINGFEQCML